MNFTIELLLGQVKRTFTVLLLLLALSFNSIVLGQFYYNKEVVSGVWVQLEVNVGCDGKVDYSLCSGQDLRHVNIVYSDGGFDSYPNEKSYLCNGSNPLTWNRTFNSAAVNATVDITFQYKQLGWHDAGIGLTYDHTANVPDIVPSYTAVLIAPNTNTYEFIYTGTGDASTCDYKFDFGDGDTFEGNGLNTTSNSEIAGGTIQSPHFYCRSDYSNLSIPTELIVYENHFLNGQKRTKNHNGTDNDVIGQVEKSCSRYETVSIILENLCPLFTGFEVNNIGPTEFNAEVTSSSSGNSILDGMVDDVGIVVSGGVGALTTISSPDQTATLDFPLGQYQNYSLTETITIESGCACENSRTYNTNNPCFNLSDITATNSFVNGEYVYTFTLSDYVGGSSNTYTITSVDVDFGDGTSGFFNANEVISHVYPDDGSYTITQTVIFNNGEYDCQQTLTFGAATYCCINFAPTPEERYWLSAWVKEDHATQQKTYENTYVEFSFDNGGSVQLHPSGDIIEGWQRIVGEFTIPSAATNMQIDLVNESTSIEAYFDDVRVHPFNASMKSYVYDPETLWLTAELDDNNYATFYEYDKEGQLIRIKKETARGIMTIQESRSSNPKSE